MHTRTADPPLFRVTVRTGKHSVVVPSGTEDVIKSHLEAAGFTTGEWKSILGSFVKGTPHTPKFRVRSIEGRSIIIRVLPGANDTCTQHRLLVPQPFNPQLVYDTLVQLSKSPQNGDSAKPVDCAAAETHEEVTTSTHLAPEDVLADPELTKLLLEVLLVECGPMFTAGSCRAVVSQYFDIPMSSVGGYIITQLSNDGFFETCPCGEEIGYMLTTTARAAIGRPPLQAVDDDLALTAGLRLSQLRADAAGYLSFGERRDQIVSEIEDLDRRRTALKEQLLQVDACMEKHPGKAAAEKWQKARTLLEIAA